mmetsp:Transcript_32056/g.42738  ORF Transcript_32056/g.42738 Transcript_32056/m.42738 type:complete len:115 (+) Transcript_32056:205-549(+)
MLLQGFMVVPSQFPDWLRWSYKVAFHTYSWRTFMYNEFHGQTFPEAVDYGLQDGDSILKIYEINTVNIGNDMIVLFCYAVLIHLFSFVFLSLKHAMWKKRSNEVDNTDNLIGAK